MSLRNVVLIRWGDGFIEGQMDASVTANGRRESLLSIANVSDGPTALHVALANIDPMSELEESVTLRVEPGTGEVPGVDYVVGDRITVPNVLGVASSYRVAACSWTQDDDHTVYVPELATARDIIDQRYQRWLTRTNNGALEGRSRSASPSSPSVWEGMQVLESITETVSTTGNYAAEVDDESPAKGMDRQLRLVRLVGTCTAAGAGNTTFEVLRNGALTGDAVTFSAATVTADAYFSAGETFALADTFAIRCTESGGHEGVAVVGHFVEPGG